MQILELSGAARKAANFERCTCGSRSSSVGAAPSRHRRKSVSDNSPRQENVDAKQFVSKRGFMKSVNLARLVFFALVVIQPISSWAQTDSRINAVIQRLDQLE